VIDFIAARDGLRLILDELEHRMLLPDRHRSIKVTADDREVLVTFEDRRWIFPRGDCVILPVENTTAELLARYIGQRLRDDLEKRTGSRPQRMIVSVDENHGQCGVWELKA
jgi:6-pyruvoyltetrahydropterin/6-carboxytetrahydropterin synthase